MAKQLGFYFDASRCANCKACQIACQDKNNLPAAIRWRRVLQYSGGTWVSNNGMYQPNNVFSYSVSLSCNHCQNAVCTQVCPTGAMAKGPDGIVAVNADECIGCRFCSWACPYGAPQFNEELGKMTKCNLCQDLLAQGGNPACVDACPMRALEFGEMDALRAKYGSVANLAPLPDPSITTPSLVITPHKHAQFSGKGTGRIMNLPEEFA